MTAGGADADSDVQRVYWLSFGEQNCIVSLSVLFLLYFHTAMYTVAGGHKVLSCSASASVVYYYFLKIVQIIIIHRMVL